MKSYIQRLYFPAVSFLAGFILMTLELASSRVIAPMLGSSVHTWTTVIGITLLGLSVGSILGGYVADKPRAVIHTLYILVASAITVAVIPPLSAWLPKVLSFDANIIWLLILVTSALFLLPGILIGMIQPMVVKQYTQDIEHLGRHYGTLSGIWSVGSILGVFLTGFVLVAWLGVDTLMAVLAITMFVVALGWAALVVGIRNSIQVLGVGIFFLCMLLSLTRINPVGAGEIVHKADTNYYQAKVVDFDYRGGPVRGLFLDVDSHSIESDVLYPDFYTSTYTLFPELLDNPLDVLVVGGGAYTLPKYFAKTFPDAMIEVLEIDPDVARIAHEYFDVGSYENIVTLLDDPRVYFKQYEKKYDLIFGDAYHSFISVPWHLITREAHQEVYDHLHDDGVYVLGFISSLSAEGKEFTDSMITTFASVFSHYDVMFFSNDETTVDTVLLFGFKNSEHVNIIDTVDRVVKQYPELLPWKDYIYGHSADLGIVFSDDYAPTERLMSEVVERYYPAYMNFYNNLFGFTG